MHNIKPIYLKTEIKRSLFVENLPLKNPILAVYKLLQGTNLLILWTFES